MKRLANATLILVAFIHIGIMCLEMFPMDFPVLLKRLESQLGFESGQGKFAAPIVLNAGLFNGFLAAGLFWSLKSGGDSRSIRFFFLGFISIAGIFGAVTLPGNTTLWIQTLPAVFAIVANLLAHAPQNAAAAVSTQKQS